MLRLSTQALLSLILTALLIPGWAVGPSIGVAIAPACGHPDPGTTFVVAVRAKSRASSCGGGVPPPASRS